MQIIFQIKSLYEYQLSEGSLGTKGQGTKGTDIGDPSAADRYAGHLWVVADFFTIDVSMSNVLKIYQ